MPPKNQNISIRIYLDGIVVGESVDGEWVKPLVIGASLPTPEEEQ